MEDNPWADLASESPRAKNTANAIPFNSFEQDRSKETNENGASSFIQETKTVATKKDEPSEEIWAACNSLRKDSEIIQTDMADDDFGDFVSSPSSSTNSQPHAQVLSPLKPEPIQRKQIE